MKVTVVGGGNIGTQFAVHTAETGHEVTIYTSTPDLYDDYLNIVDEKGLTTHEGKIKTATADPKKAFHDAELILVTFPATMMKETADEIFEHSNKDCMIGVVPGNGGSECAFKNCIDRGNTFFAIERVPAIARLVQKGRTVRSIGYRSELHVASIPAMNAEKCAEVISSIFKMPCKTIPCILNLTLTPSNPILHTSRLYSLFSDWNDGVVYDSVPLFYEEWDDSASIILINMDTEEQEICQELPEFHLDYVKSLREYYEAPTYEKMTEKICSIQAFKGLTTPVTQVANGVIPDLYSRYFTADFSYGLSIIQQIGKMAGVKTPVIDTVMGWYRRIALEKREFRYADYMIAGKDDLKGLYLR